VLTPKPTTPRQIETLSWLVHFENLAVKESVGKGAIGDYYRAMWNGKEIALKALLNQKLDEEDILNLKAKVSALR
jgi:hypothetical protein